MSAWETIEKALLNEADPLQYAVAEYRSAMKVLDDLRIPRRTPDGRVYSLVGRMNLAIMAEKDGLKPYVQRLLTGAD
jgi:hypothetical protein